MSKSALGDLIRNSERVVATFVELSLTDTDDYGNALLALAGILFSSKQYEQAIARAEEAQQLFSEIGELGGEAQALILIAKCLYAQDPKNNLSDAQSMGLRAKDIAEESCDEVATKQVSEFLKLVNKKPSAMGGQTSLPTDIEYIYDATTKILQFDAFQSRSTTVGKAAQSSSSAPAIQEGDGTTVYDPSLLKIPARKQVAFA